MDTILDYFRENGWPSMALVHYEMYNRIHDNDNLDRLFKVLLTMAEIHMGKTVSFETSLYNKQLCYLLCCQTLLRYRNIRPDGFYTLCSMMGILGYMLRAPKEYMDYFFENTKL
jgi:hypothetical protein